MIRRQELIKKYLDFFKGKKHKVIPSASIIPENDPTTLFISAGMQPLVPYLLGKKHPLGERLTNVQKCIRTGDIEEVGDSTHHTFFEMLGNWSLGDYWKEGAIKMSFEFLTEELKIPKEKLAVTIFAGEKNAISADWDSIKIWENLGINRITPLGKEDNWWGPAGETGPCGPDTEIFYWRPKESVPKEFNPNYSTQATESKRWDKKKKEWGKESHNWVEIWNDVFMEYNKNESGKYESLKQKNVDTGMGVERTIAVLNGLEDNYMTDCFKPIIEKIEEMSGKPYKGNERAMRIIADHIKASALIIASGVIPGNTEQGYVLRRLIRKSIIYGKKLGLKDFTHKIVEPVFKIYDDYPELKDKKNILKILRKEEEKFLETLDRGLKRIKKMASEITVNEEISGKKAFLFYQSYGFPLEMIRELALEWGVDVDEKGFKAELKKHQKLSRTASAGAFKSGLADNSKETTRLHTATHLLNEALRRVLGKDVKQKGSNITPERLRFDFNFSRKLTENEIGKIENLVNAKISEKLKVVGEEMSLKKALASGAQSEFGAHYPEIVSVYSIGNFSKEICTGPHVKNTSEIGKFKIVKEESSSAGIRRIKAIVK